MCLVREGIVFLAWPAVPVDWHVVFFGTYEPELRAIFRAILRPGGIAIDVGANVGWHSLLMASLVGASGRVLAVEANPSLQKRLHDNLSINCFRQVEVVPCAVGDTEGTMEFYAPLAGDPNSGNGHLGADNSATAIQTVRVNARPLDAVVAAAELESLDLIKIDVEGFEWPVLHGGERTIARLRPHIVFEYNAEYAARSGGTAEIIEGFFKTHRYRLFAVGRNWSEAIEGRWPICSDIWAVPIG